MSVFTPLSRTEIETLLAEFDLGTYQAHQGISAGTENTNFFVDTDQGRFVLTVFEKHAPTELPFFLSLGEHLHNDGCAVPQPFRTREGDFLVRTQGKPAVLFECVSGRHEQPSSEHARTLAGAMADIHQSTERFGGDRAHSHGLAWIQRSAVELRPSLDADDRDLLEQALRCLAEVDRSLPQGVIHADLFHDNALFENDRLTGIIDWYFAGVDLYALDIAIGLIDWGVTDSCEPDTARCVDFIVEYHRHRPLKPAEIDAMAELMVQAATRFWLSRALAARDNPQDDAITIKDPDAMKRLTAACLVNRAELRSALEKRLC